MSTYEPSEEALEAGGFALWTQELSRAFSEEELEQAAEFGWRILPPHTKRAWKNTAAAVLTASVPIEHRNSNTGPLQELLECGCVRRRVTIGTTCYQHEREILEEMIRQDEEESDSESIS